MCIRDRIIGNRKNLVRWQDEFWQHMVKQYPELERGESASQTGREHIPPRIFKEMTQLTKQKEQLDALLVGINPFNGKSRAAEISKVLDSYIQMCIRDSLYPASAHRRWSAGFSGEPVPALRAL